MHTEGLAEYTDPALEKTFRSVSFFMGGNVRKAVSEGRADAVPIFLHEIPKLFHQKIYRPDVALISVSPPDQHGYCSLGTSVDCVRAALQHSKVIVGMFTNWTIFKIFIGRNFIFYWFYVFISAQINKQMPRTFGDSIIHQSHFDFAAHIDEPLPSHGGRGPTEQETKIGQLIAENLVDDGATLQMGMQFVWPIAFWELSIIFAAFIYFRYWKYSGCSSECLAQSQRSWHSFGDVCRWCCRFGGKWLCNKCQKSHSQGAHRWLILNRNQEALRFCR